MVIILRHIVPNTLRPLLVLATVGIGYSILSASAPQFPWTWGDSADGGVGRIAL